MGFKRKRSDAGSSPSTASNASTTSSYYSRGDSPSPSPCAHFPTIRFDGPSLHEYDPSGRTRKRYRDQRPSEDIIYANTVHKLFAAQHQQQIPRPQLPRREGVTSMDGYQLLGALYSKPSSTNNWRHAQPQEQQQPASQSSLHRFFNISSTPKSNAMPSLPETMLMPPTQQSDPDFHRDECDQNEDVGLDLDLNSIRNPDTAMMGDLRDWFSNKNDGSDANGASGRSAVDGDTLMDDS